MSTVEERVNKLREERLAREKARIEKLREFNLKKYNKTDNPPVVKSTLQKTTSNKSLKTEPIAKKANNVKTNHTDPPKRPSTVPVPIKKTTQASNNLKPKTITATKSEIIKTEVKTKLDKPIIGATKGVVIVDKPETQGHKIMNDIKKNAGLLPKKSEDSYKVKHLPKKAFIDPRLSRRSMAPVAALKAVPKQSESRKSMIPMSNNCKKNHPNWESVFDRLYKPKTQNKTASAADTTLKPLDGKKVIKPVPLAARRKTLAEIKPTAIAAPIRRSISAVHFKKISKNELQNCIHKWSSVGEKLNKAHLHDINEDENVKEDKIVSAVKSERKRVKFQTPMLHNFNTPRPEELQSRLLNWLQKRGKSLQSYHHLQCFGLHHLNQRQIKPLAFEDACDFYDDENKENIALKSDSDDDSYTENMNDRKNDFLDADEVQDNKWRRASYASSSMGDMTSTNNVTLESDHVDELLIGALNDLTELLREGFDWEQCARWLRAIRERFPSAPQSAAYWECRAALEGTRGDLPASVHCWEEAIAKGTECSVVDANLDQLLDKFMQLKISPNSRLKAQTIDPKLVDVKNVFKSTFIKFAVQEAKLRQSNQIESPRFVVTPVRRSGRLSLRSASKRSPLRICASVRQAKKYADNAIFVPNPALVRTP